MLCNYVILLLSGLVIELICDYLVCKLFFCACVVFCNKLEANCCTMCLGRRCVVEC